MGHWAGGIWALHSGHWEVSGFFFPQCVCVGGECKSESLPSDILRELGVVLVGFSDLAWEISGALSVLGLPGFCPGMRRLWEPLSQAISNRHLGGLPTPHDTPPPSTWSWSTTWAGTC